VRLKDLNGQVTEYTLKDSALTPEQIAGMSKRRMDCVDCHNRSAHTFNPPDRAVNDSLVAGRLDPTLPYIKQQAVEILTKPYATTDEAINKIGAEMDLFYQTRHPEIYAKRRDEIGRNIAEVKRLYQKNFFPEMKVNWESYPENIGHYYSSGCFRCHDGQHVSSSGKVIRKDCALCHTVQGQTEGKVRIMGGEGKDFAHPLEVGDMAEAACTDCHTGKGVGQ
jgi:hypothetical protein